MEDIKRIISLFVIATICFTVAILLVGKKKPQTITHTTTIVVRDTVRDSIPVPYLVRKTSTRTVSFHVHDTLFHTDSVQVDVPITQKVYRDSNFRAVISGYMPNLDSMECYRRTIYQTKVVTIRKSSRFNIGIQGGYGYGINSRQFEPYIGVGITWNIFK